MQGSAMRNFSMFKQLCGENFFRNVILGSTFCDTLARDPATTERREKELIEKEEFGGR